MTYLVSLWGEDTMIVLVAASAMYLAATQASIAGPTSEFRTCLRQAGDKAKTDKVAPDAFEAYIRNACTSQGDALKSALIGFRLKNGMAHKAAADDAGMTIDDYVGTAVDNYKFMADFNKPQPAPAQAAQQVPAVPATPAAQKTPASAPQPPK